MAVSTYATDLTDISTAENDSASWDESGNTAWDDGGAIVDEQDYYIQGSYCVSQALKSGVGTSIFDYGSGITWTSGDVFMSWLYCIGPTALGTYGEGGMRMLVGSDRSTFYSWDVLGQDEYIYGGWVCIPVDPEQTADDSVGGPAAWGSMTKRYWGTALNITGNIGKGNSFGTDAMRYGRGQALFTGGESGDYCTIGGYAAANDADAARWGLIQEVSGGYNYQGLMQFGSSATYADFRDENRNIAILDAYKIPTTFNKIQISNVSTRVEMTNFTFTAIADKAGANCDFEMADDANVVLDGCSFTDMNTFDFDSQAAVTSTTFRRCNTITQNEGTFTSCIVDSSTASTAVIADNLGLITNTTFISSGSGHALEISTSTVYSLTGHTFTGYATVNGSVGSEVFYNSSNSVVTLNASGISGTVSLRGNSGATTTIVNTVPVTVTVRNVQASGLPSVTVGVFKAEDDSQIMNEYTTSVGVATEQFNYPGTEVDVYIRARHASGPTVKYLNNSTTGTVDENGLSTTMILYEDSVL